MPGVENKLFMLDHYAKCRAVYRTRVFIDLVSHDLEGARHVLEVTLDPIVRPVENFIRIFSSSSSTRQIKL
jgi:hypothetical protein